MNLDLLPLGWAHFIASLAAIAAGALVVLRPKGTPLHKLRGGIYVVAIMVTSMTALGFIGAEISSFRIGSAWQP